MQKELIKVFSTSQTGNTLTKNLNSLLCCLPKISTNNLSYENIFRVIIINFMDAYDFDVRAVKKSCVHIVHKNGKIIPQILQREGKKPLEIKEFLKGFNFEVNHY